MTPLYAAIAVVLASVVTGAVTLRIARRAKSGKIDTSEAAQLWAEGTTMRQELRDEVASLKGQLSQAITTMTDLNREIKASRAETARANEEAMKSRAETRVLMAQIERLQGSVDTSNQLSIGALADNTETRRILAVPKDERTPVEFEHLASVGERQPEGQHPPVSDDELRDEEDQVDE